MTDHRTWWRKELDKSKDLDSLLVSKEEIKKLTGSFCDCVACNFQSDYPDREDEDCIVEQLFAIREGLV